MSSVNSLYPTGKGGKTISERENNQSPDVVLFCSWFCPYGQRAWITLEELKINYKYIEIDPYKKSLNDKENKVSLSLNEKRLKYPLFIEVSPFGLIPGLIDIKNNKNKICESLICMEYLNNQYSTNKNCLSLRSSNYINSYIKIWCAHIDDRIIPFYYKMLLNQDINKQNEFKQNILDNLLIFVDEMIKNDEMNNDNYYFLGGHFSFIDISLAPWIQRMLSISKHYRNFNIPQKNTNKKWKRFWFWWDAVTKRQSFKSTVVDKNKLIDNYIDHADHIANNDDNDAYITKNANIVIGIGVGIVIGMVVRSVFGSKS